MVRRRTVLRGGLIGAGLVGLGGASTAAELMPGGRRPPDPLRLTGDTQVHRPRTRSRRPTR